MASKRSIPTDLFWDEAFGGLGGETQSIFFGLLLNADDFGRGVASLPILARKLAKDPALIQAALLTLHTSTLVQCYEVAGTLYYHITQWDTWEVLSKPTASRYPAPPDTSLPMPAALAHVSWKTPDFPGNSQAFLECPTISGIFLSEAEAEENRREAEGEDPTTMSLQEVGDCGPCPTRDGGGNGMIEETLLGDLAQVALLDGEQAQMVLTWALWHVPRTFADVFPWGFSLQCSCSVAARTRDFVLKIGVHKLYTNTTFAFFLAVFQRVSFRVFIQNPARLSPSYPGRVALSANNDLQGATLVTRAPLFTSTLTLACLASDLIPCHGGTH